MSAALLDMPTAPSALVLSEPIGPGCVLRSHRLASRATRHLKLWRIDPVNTHRSAGTDRLRGLSPPWL